MHTIERCVAGLAFALVVSFTWVLGFGAGRLAAQESAWNDARCLELVELGRERRRAPAPDSLLTSYRAAAEGFVYFLLDPEGSGEPILLRSDQVSLDLYWTAPGRIRQVLRGMRSRKQLPIRDFNYYLDRFTVIQNGFEDEIVVGGGQDVHSVVHPLAPGGRASYDYRLADSIALRLPGRAEEVRVYEVQVRPRDPSRPAFVGSLFLERTRGDLVRMAFTFTPASYLDPRNERVEIVLENGLWEDRYWLPHEQRLLVRRELPELDLDVGTVIRAVLSVRDYRFNEGQATAVTGSSGVVFQPGAGGLHGYPFENDLQSGQAAAGVGALAPPGALLELDYRKLMAAAAAMPGSGLPPLRLYVPGASSVFRFNRAEGVVTSLGVSYRPRLATASVLAGYGWGDGRPRLDIQVSPGSGGTHLKAFLNHARDLAPGPTEAGLLNSVGAAFLGADFLDSYLVTGIEAVHGRQLFAGMVSLGIRMEWQRPATLVQAAAPLQAGRALRPVLAGEHGTAAVARVSYDRSLSMPLDVAGHVSGGIDAGLWQGRGFARGSGRLQLDWRGRGGGAGAGVAISGGAGFGHLASQHLYFLGGRGTLPGYPYRAFAGEHYLLVNGDSWHAVASQLVNLRLLIGAGWIGSRDATRSPETVPDPGSWDPTVSDRFLAYTGAGLGFFDRLLRLDYLVPAGRGLGHGRWLLSIAPRLHALL